MKFMLIAHAEPKNGRMTARQTQQFNESLAAGDIAGAWGPVMERVDRRNSVAGGRRTNRNGRRRRG